MQNLNDTTIQREMYESPTGDEGGRRPTEEPVGGAQQDIPDAEVSSVQRKKTFSAAYKLRILEELDACTEPGQKGAILRREGIYSSCITYWRKQRQTGALNGLNKKRGRKLKYDVKDQRISELERQNQNLQKRLEQAESIIDIQKKISETFGLSMTQTNTSENNS